jgi:hypothetical protein
MIPKELEEILSFDEDDIDVRLTKAVFENGNLVVDFILNANDIHETILQVWTVTALRQGLCQDVPKLFYQIYHTHKSLFGNYQLLDIPSLEEKYNLKPLQYSSGLLAKGPQKLMEQYAVCLTQNGLDYSFAGAPRTSALKKWIMQSISGTI